jgi:NCS2 family nucleobase:cation symporter-2
MGLVDFSQVTNASWVQLPNIARFGINFNPKFVVPFIAGYLVTVIETVGVMETLGEVTESKLTENDIVAAVRADAVSSFISPFFGSGPAQTFSQNVGLIPLTKCASKFVAVVTGILLIVMSLFPKFSTIVSIMPSSVLGGAGILMFGTVAVSGIKTLAKVKFTNYTIFLSWFHPLVRPLPASNHPLSCVLQYQVFQNSPASFALIFHYGINIPLRVYP